MKTFAVKTELHVRVIAIMALGAAAALFSGCETISQDVKGLSSALKPTTPAEAARMMVDPHNADNRRAGTVLIANATFGGGEVYLKTYRDMVLNERDPIVKAVAIRALAKHGAPEDAERIALHLRVCEQCIRRNRDAGIAGSAADAKRQDCKAPACLSDNAQVRLEATKGLQRLHNPSVVADLLRVLRNESEPPDIRLAAAVALAQYPEDRVFHGLVAALDARELAINSAAETSLATLTGQSFGMDSLQWLDWYNSVASSDSAFAGRTEYLYPTYTRDETVWEKLTFWTSHHFEQPAPPAGLRPKDERSTYQDQQEASANASGG